MPSRDRLAKELERLKAHWPSMPVSGLALDNYAHELAGYDDQELQGAISLLLHEYDSAANPKPKHVSAYCARVAKVRRRATVAAAIETDGEAYCPHCGTRTLVEVPAVPIDTESWTAKAVAWWHTFLGQYWPVGDRYIVRPPRLHPLCSPTCPRHQWARREEIHA